MPCDLTVKEPDILEAMQELEAKLGSSDVGVYVDPGSGAVALQGWEDESRRGVSDVCAIRRLMVDNSWEWQQALSQAETMAGRQMDTQMLAAGTHSHDGGGTWHPGH